MDNKHFVKTIIFLLLFTNCYEKPDIFKIELINSFPIEDMKSTGLKNNLEEFLPFVVSTDTKTWIAKIYQNLNTLYSVTTSSNHSIYVGINEKELFLFINNNLNKRFLNIDQLNIDNFKPLGILELKEEVVLVLFFNDRYNIFKLRSNYSLCQWSSYEFL